MTENLELKSLYSYLEALEAVNQELVTALKKCLQVLAQFEMTAPDRSGWQEMLQDINRIIRTGEALYDKKVIH
jgi:hypothetical protein